MRDPGGEAGRPGWRCCWGNWRTASPPPAGTERALEDREIADLISAFLRRLTKESRVIFLRRYWYGQTVVEIASDLNCGAGKVKSSLFRTRNALRNYLEQGGGSRYEG